MTRTRKQKENAATAAIRTESEVLLEIERTPCKLCAGPVDEFGAMGSECEGLCKPCLRERLSIGKLDARRSDYDEEVTTIQNLADIERESWRAVVNAARHLTRASLLRGHFHDDEVRRETPREWLIRLIAEIPDDRLTR